MSVPTRAEIIAAYARREAKEGGPFKADARAILHEIADELAITYERARDAMLDEWTAGGMQG